MACDGLCKTRKTMMIKKIFLPINNFINYWVFK